MTHPRDYSVLDAIGMALEATCDALLTLQSIQPRTALPEDGSGERHIARAISDLREAIDELHEAQAQGQTGLALGFVLAQSRGESSGEGGPRQSIPRRTA